MRTGKQHHAPGLVQTNNLQSQELKSNEKNLKTKNTYPRRSMYGIFTYIGVVLGVNVCKYASPMECMGIIVCTIQYMSISQFPYGSTYLLRR